MWDWGVRGMTCEMPDVCAAIHTSHIRHVWPQMCMVYPHENSERWHLRDEICHIRVSLYQMPCIPLEMARQRKRALEISQTGLRCHKNKHPPPPFWLFVIWEKTTKSATKVNFMIMTWMSDKYGCVLWYLVSIISCLPVVSCVFAHTRMVFVHTRFDDDDMNEGPAWMSLAVHVCVLLILGMCCSGVSLNINESCHVHMCIGDTLICGVQMYHQTSKSLAMNICVMLILYMWILHMRT